VYTPVFSRQFKRDYQRLLRSGRSAQEVDAILAQLLSGARLPSRCQDHPLKGEYRECRECHVSPDLLLIYCIESQQVKLIRLGSHAALFG
jgi:mRNA interferase YafQ